MGWFAWTVIIFVCLMVIGVAAFVVCWRAIIEHDEKLRH